jgi:hypothetical protein
MSTNPPRNFNCKNEELPIICGFSAISLGRDLNAFSAYSPQFDAAYLEDFKAKIDTAQELVQPKAETIELKMLNERIYANLDALVPNINHVEGYLELARKNVPLSTTDFGLAQLRKSCRSRDVENVMTQLRTVETNIAKYKKQLAEKGLTETLAAKFTEAGTTLAADRKTKYEIVSSRMALVQGNIAVLNELYDQLTEICKIGKILFKQTDKAKLNDYTVSYLLKQVRRKDKPADPKSDAPPAPETV